MLITTSHSGSNYAKNNSVQSNKITRAGEYGIEDNGNGGNSYCGNSVNSPQIGISNVSIDVTTHCN